MQRKACLPELFCWTLLIAMSLLAYLFQTQFFMESDVIYLVNAADALYHGGSYTENFFETNPPLILYLYLPILAFIYFLKIKLVIATRLYLIGLAFISLALSNYLLIKSRLSSRTRHFLLLTIGFTFFFLPFVQFGQREHFLLILTMPYWFLATLRAEKIEVPFIAALGTGLFAGLGFALKPFFLIPLILVELYLCLRNRVFTSVFRIETVALFFIFIMYAILIFTFQPDYLKTILPLVLKYYFIGSAQPWSYFLRLSPALFCFATVLLSPFICSLIRAKSLAIVLSLALLGLTLCFLIPKAAWYYHVLPAFGISFLLGALLISEYENIFMTTGFTLVFLIIPVLNGYGLLKSGITIKNNIAFNQLLHFTQDHFPGKKIYCMSRAKSCALLSAYAGSQSVSRFPSLWVLYGTLLKPNYPGASQDIRFFLSLFAKDVDLKKPDLFIFDKTENLEWIAKDKDYIDYFSQNPAFKKAWTSYHHLKTIPPFELYVRYRD